MGWAVGWHSDHGRFRGYGVPAYCDAKGCIAEIDRGLGFVCECEVCGDEDDLVVVAAFVCGFHTCADVDPANRGPEHPDWISHVSTDASWAKWRKENPERLAAMTADLET